MPSAEPPVSPPSLAVAIIARDAADLLPETLDSIRSIADEIVVLDTGSTDKTVQRAREGGAKVHRRRWEDDFSAARNSCLKLVTSDWVLWLDAGETMDEITATRLRKFVDRTADLQKAYLMFVQLAPNAPQLSGEQVGQLRLMPVRQDLQFTGRIREQILPSILAAGLDVDALTCHIQRPQDDHALDRKSAKAKRNLRIAAIAEKEQGEKPILLMVQAEAHQTLGRFDEAERYYRRTIEVAQRGSSEMLEAYYGLLTSFDHRPTESETQIAACLEALDVFPLDAQLLCGLGSYLIKQGRLDLAARSYEIAAMHGQVDPSTWHLADIGEVAVSCLALTHQLQNQLEAAFDVLRRGLEQRPESSRLRRQLLELHIKRGDRAAALAEFDRLPREFPGREAFRSAVRGALLSVERNWPAAEPYLKTAFTAGCRDVLCLRWLFVSYLALGKLDLAADVLRSWQEFDPSSAEIPTYERALAERRSGREHQKPTRFEGQSTADRPAAASPGERNLRIDEASHGGSKEAPIPPVWRSVAPGTTEPPATV